MRSESQLLPPTYYDILLQREIDKPLVNAARENINELDEGAGPFGSVDECGSHFEPYLEKHIFKHFQNTVHNKFLEEGIDAPEVIKHHTRELFSSPDFKKLLYSKSIDYLFLINFELFGKKTFYLNPNLITQLLATDLEVDSEFLKLPFTSCMFVLSAPVSIRAFYAMQNEDTHNVDTKTPISVFAYERAAEEGGRKIVFACWHANRANTYSFVKRELLIRPGWKIGDSLRTNWNELHQNMPRDGRSTVNEQIYGLFVDDSNLIEGGVDFFRIVLNAILYIGCNEASIIHRLSPHPAMLQRLNNGGSRSKRKKIKNVIRETSSLDYAELGSDVEPIIVSKPGHSNSKHGAGLNVSAKRYIVRGHWRNQAYGENRVLRKLIWIRPYYKGPEISELISKPYLVK